LLQIKDVDERTTVENAATLELARPPQEQEPGMCGSEAGGGGGLGCMTLRRADRCGSLFIL
jgi:hypothetical protein